MTFSDLKQLVWIKLGNQHSFYPEDEVGRLLNQAQRLVCLTYPRLLRQRAALTLSADNPFVDLRLLQNLAGDPVGRDLRQVRRVVLGDVRANAPVPNVATGELQFLPRTSVERLSTRSRDWLRHQGVVEAYYIYGRVWLGIYRRPVAATTMTVIYDAAPVLMVADNDRPQVPVPYHDVIAEVASGLATMKEGLPRSLSVVGNALGLIKERQPA